MTARASSADLIARIGALAAAEPGGAIAFDGDGTLWDGDIGEDLFEAILGENGVRPEATRALVAEAEAAGLSAGGTGSELARRLDDAYRAGSFSEERIFEIITWIFAGFSFEEASQFADRLLDRVDLKKRLHPETITILDWARKSGITTLLVSASPRVVVHPAARRVGIDLACVASAHENRAPDGIIVPSVDRPIPYGPGKVQRLREKVGQKPLYAAFGDNAFDLPMLAEAKIPVAVRPKPRLRERLLTTQLPGLVILDPA